MTSDCFCFLLSAFCFSSRVTDYGARGDAVRTTCTTKSNSTWIVTSQQFSDADVGKLALLYGVGPITSGTNRQDRITTVLAAEGRNVTVREAPSLSAEGVNVTIGTQNQPAFQKAINA